MSLRSSPGPLFQKIDCLQVPVPDLEAGLAFYRDKLGHELIWRTETAAGLRMPETDAEIVIQTERPPMEANIQVASAEKAVERMVEAGGKVVSGPFDIQIGRCAVVLDPFGNPLVLLDTSKGRLVTDDAGNVTGVERSRGEASNVSPGARRGLVVRIHPHRPKWPGASPLRRGVGEVSFTWTYGVHEGPLKARS